MRKYNIDFYHYCSDKKVDDYYRGHELNEVEKQKTEEFMKKMEDFIIKTNGEEDLNYFHNFTPEGVIQYREKYGYITIGNYDRDEVTVDGYGRNLEEAFINATIDYELSLCVNYECYHRKELNRQYSERFLNGNYSENDYHGPFFFAELALQDFRKYYGDNIPEEIIKHYENHLVEINEGNYKYDYETNSLVKVKENVKVKKH